MTKTKETLYAKISPCFMVDISKFSRIKTLQVFSIIKLLLAVGVEVNKNVHKYTFCKVFYLFY